jgi:hypothetical protein
MVRVLGKCVFFFCLSVSALFAESGTERFAETFAAMQKENYGSREIEEERCGTLCRKWHRCR